VAVALLIAAGAVPSRGDARMTVVYDVLASVQALTGLQPDGGPGLRVEDGLFQQQPATAVLPAGRQVGKVSGGAGSTVTPSIQGMSGPAMAALFRTRVDGAGAGILFVDELGQGPEFGGADGASLEAAMVELGATPHSGGGSYADRVQMYVNPERPIADPAAWAPFWRAMALAGGVWFEAYQGRVQWSAEHWLAWPRVLRDGLMARGLDPTRIHVIVRGAAQAAVWSNMRVGAACALLANGPGAYRIEDQAGFVSEFRATFGLAPAPAGSSPVACAPLPVIAEPRAGQLAAVLELERTGARIPPAAPLPGVPPVGVPTILSVALGPDPLGLAGRLGADPPTFWAAARAQLTAIGPGVGTSARLAPDGSARVTATPAAGGPISLGLVVDGGAIRQAIGPPADLAISLAPYTSRLGPVLDRIIAQPTSWQLAIPLTSEPRDASPSASPPRPAPPRVTARILRRRRPPTLSLVELLLSRPARRLLVEVGAVTRGRFVRVKLLRITGRRIIIRVRIPRGASVRARVVIRR
jgi:hypothetical protein